MTNVGNTAASANEATVSPADRDENVHARQAGLKNIDIRPDKEHPWKTGLSHSEIIAYGGLSKLGRLRLRRLQEQAQTTEDS